MRPQYVITIITFLCIYQSSIILALKETTITVNGNFSNCINVNRDVPVIGISLNNFTSITNTSCDQLTNIRNRTTIYDFKLENTTTVPTKLFGVQTGTKVQSSLINVYIGNVVSGYSANSCFVYVVVSPEPDLTACTNKTGPGVTQTESIVAVFAVINNLIVCPLIGSTLQMNPTSYLNLQTIIDLIVDVVGLFLNPQSTICSGQLTTNYNPGLMSD